jgi:hypothetical protein
VSKSSADRTAFRVVVPPCDCCGAGADEQCAADCAERVEFEPAFSSVSNLEESK